MAMQRDGQTDDRTKSGASGRTPPVIDAQAVEVASGDDKPAAPENLEGDVSPHVGSPQDAAEGNDAEPASGEIANGEDGALADAIAAPPPRKKRRGAMAAILGLIVVGAAGAVAWIATPGHREGDIKSRIIALLPQSAQRALHRAPAPGPQVGDKTAAPQASAPVDMKPAAQADKPAAPVEPQKTEAAKPEAPKSEALKSEVPKTETEKPVVLADKPASGDAPASSTAAPTGGAQSGNMTVVGNPPVAIGVDPRRIEDMSVKIDGLQAKFDALQSKVDATLGRLDSLQSKLDLAQGKLDVVPSADAVTQAAQRIETLTQRLAAMEQKLEQPKTDTRAPQARENATPSGREFAASRAVVAQATSEALRAGAPLADNLAALKGLGVADDKIGDLAPYAKTGAPTAAQLTAQWRGLREKVVALDAPPPGASFGDKMLAKARSVFRITWAGQGAQNSIGSTVARVDGALQRNDLAGAVAACADFPAAAKNLVADWQTAAAARLKADAAARALLSESISAIGRSSSQ